MKFTECTPIEKGFAQVFDAQVKPKLMEFEFERQAVVRKTYIRMALIVAVAAVIIAAAAVIADGERLAPAVILSGMGVAIGLFWVWDGAANRWGSKVKDAAMPAICAHVGDLRYTESGGSFSLHEMLEMKLLPKHDNAIRKNLLSGSYHGTKFQMVHATLTFESSGDSGKTTNFEGLLFRIDVPQPAPGQIALMRDRGGVGNKLAETFSFGSTRSLPKVTVDNAEFEAAFEVYATRPDEAKAYLSTDLINALLQIGSEQGQGQGAQSFVAGFHGRYFYMALKRTGSFMKVGGLTTPVTEIEDDLHGVFDDIALAHQVIDRLNRAITGRDTQN